MATKPKILLVNDDGADAPGLWALYRRIASIGEPIVMAPMYEQSGRSQAVTVRRQMALRAIERDGRKVGYCLDGMPADCVKLALAHFYRGQVAMVVSGINWGANMGHNILYSGTVGAALEGAMYGLPAMAVSLRDDREPPMYPDTAARVARRLGLDILAHGLPPGVVLNVNVPDLPLGEISGIAVTRQGQERYIDLFDFGRTKDGTQWCSNLGGERLPSSAAEHPLDDLTLNKNQISITPLHFDLTSENSLGVLSERIERLRLTAEGITPMPEEIPKKGP